VTAPDDELACGHLSGEAPGGGEGPLVAIPARRDPSDAWAWPAGAALTDVESLLAWALEARNEPLLSANPVATGEGFTYGLGVRVEAPDSPSPLFWHTGSLGDGWAQLVWTENGDAVAILANRYSPLAATTMTARREIFGVEETAEFSDAVDAVAGDYEVRGWEQPITVHEDASSVRLDIPELGTSGLRAERPGAGDYRASWPLNGAPLDFRFIRLAGADGRVETWIRSKLFIGRRIEGAEPNPSGAPSAPHIPGAP